jgi:plasmid maintenance system antidote protein VapI
MEQRAAWTKAGSDGSRAKMADFFGVVPTTYSKIIHGHDSLAPKHYTAWAQKLGVSVQAIQEAAEETAPIRCKETPLSRYLDTHSISREELARRMNVTQRRIATLCRSPDITYSTMAKVLRSLGVSLKEWRDYLSSADAKIIPMPRGGVEPLTIEQTVRLTLAFYQHGLNFESAARGMGTPVEDFMRQAQRLAEGLGIRAEGAWPILLRQRMEQLAHSPELAIRLQA